MDRRRQWHPTPVLLPGKSHGWRSPVGYSPWGRWGSDTTERLHFHFSLLCIGEGNGNPLQCSCLENPRDGGAWLATVYRVTQSRTRLKWLGSSVWMGELDHKESWAPKNWCFRTVVLEKTPQSPLDSKEIKPVNPKGNQSWIFIGRTDAETEPPIFWPPDVKNGLIGKDSDAGKDWRQEKGMTEDEMIGWYHQLDGHEFE